MKKFIFGFITSLIIVLVAITIYLGLVSTEIQPADIQATAFRLVDDSVLVFVRDYLSLEKQDAIQPFLIVVSNKDNTAEIQTVPEGIIESNRLILSFAKDMNHVQLFSTEFPEWIEFDVRKKVFKLHKNTNHPSIEDSIIMLDFKRSK